MKATGLKVSRRWVGAVVLTLILQLLVAFAGVGELSHTTLVVLLATAIAVGVFHVTFGSSPLTVTVLATLLAFYACFFIIMLRYNFPKTEVVTALVAYPLPVAGLLLGAWLRRAEIAATKVNRDGAAGKSSGFPFAWLVPLILISVATLVPPTQELGAKAQNATLLFAMAVVASFVLVMSPSVIAFILYTGEVFRGFFKRLSRLAAPAVAFLSLRAHCDRIRLPVSNG